MLHRFKNRDDFVPTFQTPPDLIDRLGIQPALTGTTDADHMRMDLDVFDFHPEPEELQTIERLASQG